MYADRPLPYNTRALGRSRPVSFSKVGERDKTRVDPNAEQHGYGGVYIGSDMSLGRTVTAEDLMATVPVPKPASPQNQVLENAFQRPQPSEPALQAEANDGRLNFSRTALMQQRKHADLPDLSFDIDGDGVVGQRDMFLATRFDANRDGKLSEEERGALKNGTFIGKDGVTIPNTVQRVVLKDVVPHGELPPRSKMFEDRRVTWRAESDRNGDKEEALLQAGHAEVMENLPNTYPWSTKDNKAWGKSMAVDKICKKYPEDVSYNDVVWSDFPPREQNVEDYERESEEIGKGVRNVQLTAEEVKQRKSRAMGKRNWEDHNTRILNMSQRRKPITYDQTYDHVIGRPGGSAYALPTSEWTTTNRRFFGRPGSPLSQAGASSMGIDAHKEAKKKYAGTGVVRANHTRYTHVGFNNGNELVDNVVGHSKYSSAHYMPFNAYAEPH